MHAFSSAFHYAIAEKKQSGRNYVLHPVLEVSVMSQVEKRVASPLVRAQCDLTCKEKE